jgi:hypothetical protein
LARAQAIRAEVWIGREQCADYWSLISSGSSNTNIAGASRYAIRAGPRSGSDSPYSQTQVVVG